MKLAEVCVRRPVFATMLVLTFVVLGVFSYTQLGIDQFPKIDLPTVTVQTTLPGASPEEVESQITKPVEEVLNTISGIDELRSTTLEGVSLVVVQFVLDKNADVAAQEVRDKVRSAIRAQDVAIPGGRIDQGPNEVTLRTLGRVENVRDFEKLIIATVKGAPVYLRDIAKIEDGYEEPRSLARQDGNPSVSLL